MRQSEWPVATPLAVWWGRILSWRHPGPWIYEMEALVRGEKEALLMTGRKKLGLGILAVGLWFLFQGVVLEPLWVQTRDYRMEIDELSPGQTLRVAVLGDLHIGGPLHGIDHLRDIVEQTNEARPDLVFLVGDYVYHGVGGETPPLGALGEVLGQLRAPLGVYAVLGNHDWWEDQAAIYRSLARGGVMMLEDKALRVVPQGDESRAFWVGGVSDLWEGQCDLQGVLKQVRNPEEPLFLLSHNPDVFDRTPERVALMVAGHTHGGQVRIPGVGPLMVPANRAYAEGHIRQGGRDLFVTPGLGNSVLPVRLFILPEISLMTLVGR